MNGREPQTKAPQALPQRAAPSQSSRSEAAEPTHPTLDLQQKIGNQAVGRLAAAGQLETAPGVMELQGQPTFDPPAAIANFLNERTQAMVNVQFGRLAAGPIEVRTKNRGKSQEKEYQIKKQGIGLTHPIFGHLAQVPDTLLPSLILRTERGQIKGHIGLGRGLQKFESEHLEKASDMLGLTGFSLGPLPKIINEVEGGSLHVGFRDAKISLGSAFSGRLTLESIDEKITFAGNADISVKHLATGKLELNRAEDGMVTGKASVGVTFPSKNVSGNVEVAWDGQAISGQGKVGYQGEKLQGEVTLNLMEKSLADQLKREKQAPPEEVKASVSPREAKPKPKGGKVDYAVFGEGDLTFAFTDWLNGTAHVIIDHQGYATIIGEITPQKEFTLFEQQDYIKQLFKVEARAAYGIPVVGNIFIFANVGMDAFAKLGPGKFYKIAVKGTYSTDPKEKKNFSIQGTLNISAAAGLRLRGEAGAGLEILDHDIKAGAGINGIAGIRGYAEATPVIGYREEAAEGEDKKGEFFIRGDLEIAAQPFLGLSGDLFVELDSPWWSPAPDKKWTWPLGDKEWPIGGTFGIGASVDYVFGSKQLPSVEFKPVDFSVDKFMTDLYQDKVKPKTEVDEQKGKWNEKNTPEAEAPSGPEGKGDATPGKAPEPPPAQATVQPGGPKAPKTAADPNAKTAEGKTVGELQDEAIKQGKKPEGKAPAAPATEEPTDASQAKQEHDEKLRPGLAALEAVTARYAQDGATKEEIVGGVKSVRRKFTVFKSIEVIDGGETWDYQYVASNGKLVGPAKSKSKDPVPNLSTGDLVRIHTGKEWAVGPFQRFWELQGTQLIEVAIAGAKLSKPISSLNQDRGWKAYSSGATTINYGSLDSLERPTGIKATLGLDQDAKLPQGSAASSSIRPPGFEGESAGHARGHLLGNQLGGSGSQPENLVTVFQNPVNTPLMSGYEARVRKAVERGEIVTLRVTPIYQGSEGMPIAVTIEAKGDGTFSLSVSIPNRK